MTEGMEISVDEVVAQLDEVGRAKFDLAVERAKNRKLQARIDDLERQRNPEEGPR